MANPVLYMSEPLTSQQFGISVGFKSGPTFIVLDQEDSKVIIIIIIIIIILYSNTYMHINMIRYIFEKVDRELIPIKGPLTELCQRPGMVNWISSDGL